MSKIIVEHSLNEMGKSLADYYPGGLLWAGAQVSGTNLNALTLGLSGELLRAEQFLALYNSDFIPDTTVSFIDEWEKAIGIPDECFPGDTTGNSIDTRRLQILVKLASLGVQTTADFLALADILGFVGTEITSGIGADFDSVINGTFDTDTDWTKGTGWTISGGTANKAAGVASDLEQDISANTGIGYLVTYDIIGLTAGTVTPVINGTSGTTQSANGTFQELIIAGSTGTSIVFEADSAFDGSLDNVIARGSVNPLSEARFTIVVTFPFVGNNFPLAFPIPFGDDTFQLLTCLYTKLKPANCHIQFRSN